MTEPVLLLPGLASDARVFFHQLVTLSLSRPVTVLPLVGALVEDMSLAVLKAAPACFALAGQGLGGTVALEVVRRAPGRVTRMILISTDPSSETPQAAAAREARMIQARAGRLREAIQGEVPPVCPFRRTVAGRCAGGVGRHGAGAGRGCLHRAVAGNSAPPGPPEDPAAVPCACPDHRRRGGSNRSAPPAGFHGRAYAKGQLPQDRRRRAPSDAGKSRCRVQGDGRLSGQATDAALISWQRRSGACPWPGGAPNSRQ